MVGLEPSCVAVFRDELKNLYPHEQDAMRLSRQTFELSEFLDKHTGPDRLPKLKRKALVHGHCHHKAVMAMDGEHAVLRKIGLDLETPETGCCGMAGSFGFEEGKCEVSVKCGERVLLPAVREASEDTLIIADGFSCREQIGQLSGRRGLHVAQVLEMAMDTGPEGPREGFPEKNYPGVKDPPRRPSTAAMILAGAAAAAGFFVARKLISRMLWR